MAILERRVCNKNYKNIAALNCVLKKALDEITPDKLRDICTATLHRIEDVVQNSGRYIEYFFGHLQLTYK